MTSLTLVKVDPETPTVGRNGQARFKPLFLSGALRTFFFGAWSISTSKQSSLHCARTSATSTACCCRRRPRSGSNRGRWSASDSRPRPPLCPPPSHAALSGSFIRPPIEATRLLRSLGQDKASPGLNATALNCAERQRDSPVPTQLYPSSPMNIRRRPGAPGVRDHVSLRALASRRLSPWHTGFVPAF